MSDDDTIDLGNIFRRKKTKDSQPSQSASQPSTSATVHSQAVHSTNSPAQAHSSHSSSHSSPSHSSSSHSSTSHSSTSHSSTSHSHSSSSHSSSSTSHSDKISFASVKQFFKNFNSSSTDSESVDFDFRKHAKWIIPALIIAFTFYLAFFIRAQTYDLNAAEGWAEDSVLRFYKNQFEGQINQQFPNLPPENKQVLINNELQNFRAENEDVIQQQVEATSQQYKEQFRDPNGETYLLGIDPYYYYRQALNILTYGNVGTELRDGMPFDTFKPAPEGSFIEPNLHPYLIVAVYKILNFFGNFSLVRAFFYVGPLVSALCVIPAFFIAARMGGFVGGFFAAIFTAVNFFFVNRSAGETSDTDSYNVLFPLLISWTFLISLYQKDWKKHIGFTVLTGFLIAFYSFAWTGWWFILYFLSATIVVRIIYGVLSDSLQQRKIVYWSEQVKRNLIHFGVLILSVAVFTPFFVGLNEVQRLVFRPFQFLALKEVAAKNIWPNVLTTVAELNPASLDSVINQLGGYFLVTLAILGILYTLKRSMNWLELSTFTLLGLGISIVLAGYSQEQTGIIVFGVIFLLAAAAALYYLLRDILTEGLPDWDVTYVALFGLWLGVTLWSTTRGVRFTLLIVPALTVGVGLFCGILYNTLRTSLHKELHVPQTVANVILFLLLLLVLIYPTNHVQEGYSVGVRSVPSMNDGWYDALAHIRDNSTSNTIITSWWDFGHWFKAIADRPVTFDGGSQNRPQAHWVGKLFLTPDEKVSFGLLRMLDCGANGAFDAIDLVVQDTERSVAVVNEVIIRNRDDAALYLRENGFTDGQIDSVLKNTHCSQPPEGYVIASNDMIGKSGVWGHFGAWNFQRASMVFETNDLSRDRALTVLTSKFNLSAADAEKTYREIQNEDVNRWIAPWPGYAGGSQNCRTDNSTIVCTLDAQGAAFDLHIDRATMNTTIPTTQGTKYPNALVYLDGDQLIEKKFTDDRIGLSVALIPAGDSFEAVVSDPLQANSMFTQMFFYEGRSLKCFELFDKRREITGGLIYIYKVNWDCQL